MKNIIVFMLILATFLAPINVLAESKTNIGAEYNLLSPDNLVLSAKSAVLMDATTGEILYMKNPDEALAPASVTKIMTLLLFCEALQTNSFTLDDMVIISADAAAKGGSQIFLEEGEQISVRDLLKSTIIASANDAAVALAELVAGNESTFVTKMNEKAKELSLTGSHFENATGLDDTVTTHTMSARDIATISKELIRYPEIIEFASVWQDTIRNGEFTLTNTNRLVRYYDGCNGLKTGSTDKAGFCLTATAKRDNMQLIAVVMGADTRDERNRDAKFLLDYGFSNYAIYEDCESVLESIPIYRSICESVTVKKNPFIRIVKKSDLGKIETIYNIPEIISGPCAAGSSVGKVVYKVDNIIIGETEITTSEAAEKLSYWNLLLMFFGTIIK